MQLEKFLGCISLKTGGIVVGSIDAIFSLIAVFAMCHAVEVSTETGDYKYYKLIIRICMNVLLCSSALLLIVGCVKDQVKRLLPWLTIATFYLILRIGFLFEYIGGFTSVFFLDLFQIALLMYGMLAVYSLYLVMVKEPEAFDTNKSETSENRVERGDFD